MFHIWGPGGALKVGTRIEEARKGSLRRHGLVLLGATGVPYSFVYMSRSFEDTERMKFYSSEKSLLS